MKQPLIIVLLALLSLCDVVHSSCNICGDGKEVGNPDAVVIFNTLPPSETPCGQLQSLGDAGLIPEAQCGRLPQYLSELGFCECRVPEPETSAIAEKNSTNGATKSGKKTSSKATKGSKSSKIFASKASTKSSKGKGTTSSISAGAESTKEDGGESASTASSSSAATTAKPTGTKSSKNEDELSKAAKASSKNDKVASAKSGKGDSSKEVGAKSGSYKSKAGDKGRRRREKYHSKALVS